MAKQEYVSKDEGYIDIKVSEDGKCVEQLVSEKWVKIEYLFTTIRAADFSKEGE